ncbi:MAG: hypothetical protein KDK08_15905, partial [Rhizobiaceae bacterium]|nr:hypothetical protein [Rhizobiaceae bacterium]
AAHEGVPVARLPGGWSGGAGVGAPPTPAVAVGSENSASQTTARRPKADVKNASSPRNSDPTETSSIKRPSVGVGASAKKDVSILDIILGERE